MVMPRDTIRKSLDIEDASPFADMAEQMLAAFALSDVSGSIANIYHDLVEALIHPYNADAIKGLRDFVAQNREHRVRTGRKPSDETIGRMCLDAEAVLAHLGLEPSDYEREVKPVLQAHVKDLMKSAEDFIGEHVAEGLKTAPEVIFSGPGKLQN